MKRYLILPAIALLFILTACGGSDDSVDSTPISSISEPEDKPAGSVKLDTFKRLWIDPPTLDPHLVTDTSSAGLVVEIFSGLMTINTDLQVVTDLAESYDISEDKRTYTFYIRKNAKFHNGREITASDVKYSIERAADPKTLSPVADTYLIDIVGVEDKLNGKADDVSGVKVIDKHTVQITIDDPKVYFLAKLTYPTAFVVDQENIMTGGKRWTDKPNGTGPFKLSEYAIGDIIVLERHDEFYGEKAKVSKVEFLLSGGQAMAMYENDEIHFTGVGLADLDRLLNPSEPLNSELQRIPPEFSINYIGFNVGVPPFDDVKFRQALNHAINKELIAEQVYSGLVIPAYGILPPGLPGYNTNLQGLNYDPNKAVELLSQSKYATDIPRIQVTVPGSGGSVGLDLEVILDMWNDILGVQIETTQVDWATFLQDLNDKKLQAFAGLGWAADYPDPQNFIDVLFYGSSTLNHTGYKNTKVDQIIEKARTESDFPIRSSLYKEAEQIIVNESPWIPLWYSGESYVLIKPYVKGYKMTPLIVPKLSHVEIIN